LKESEDCQTISEKGESGLSIISAYRKPNLYLAQGVSSEKADGETVGDVVDKTTKMISER